MFGFCFAKIVFIGDSNTGKSSILNRFINNSFSSDYIHTAGADCKKHTFTQNNIFFNVQNWDTTGNRTLKSLVLAIVNGAHCVVVVFDRKNRSSFEGVEFWMEDLKKDLDQKTIYWLLGNKSDLEPEVSTEEAQEMAEKHGMKYIETSALTNDNINVIFEHIIEEVALG